MVTVDSTTFQHDTEAVLHQALKEPVAIMQHGHRAFVLMSADHYGWLRAAAQRAHRTVDATDIVIDAVERASMDGRRGQPGRRPE